MAGVILSLTFVALIHAKEESKAQSRVAAALQLPRIPGLEGAPADWQQWDSFFTFVVKQFGQEISGTSRDSLGEAFLESRYELTRAIARLGAGQNPVPQLFLTAWSRLSPVINKALPVLPKETASRYATFIGAVDNLAALGKQGSQLGVLQLSPDALRGLARILEPSGRGDPIAYNLDVDNALRNLVGLGAPIAAPPGPNKAACAIFPLLQTCWKPQFDRFGSASRWRPRLT